MSTFNGKIVEIPKISADNFEGDNVNSLVYFLSHCHSDHMRGLDNIDFQNSLLQRPGVYLYASSISIKILKNIYKDKSRYPRIESKLKVIPVNHPTLIKIPETNQSFTVTTIPAGHCPGSVMFLFEIDNKNILYTGDYRASANDLEKFKAFYSLGNLKRIDKMYLDTTFFNKSYLKFPPRRESLEQICSAIKEWIEQDPKHLVNITPTAKYGSEFLFMEIAKEMQMPIHVNEDCYNVYKCIPEMDNAVTLNPAETRIHSNCGIKYKQICLTSTEFLREIVPSALWWRGKNLESFVEEEHENKIRICYSSHASFEEVKDFLLLLKPAEVEPCVVPTSVKEKIDLTNLLEQIMLSYKVDCSTENVKLFDRVEVVELQDDDEEDNLPDDLLHSPKNDFKRRRKWLVDGTEL